MLVDQVKRDNPEDKVKDLFDKFSYLSEMLYHQNSI